MASKLCITDLKWMRGNDGEKVIEGIFDIRKKILYENGDLRRERKMSEDNEMEDLLPILPEISSSFQRIGGLGIHPRVHMQYSSTTDVLDVSVFFPRRKLSEFIGFCDNEQNEFVFVVDSLITLNKRSMANEHELNCGDGGECRENDEDEMFCMAHILRGHNLQQAIVRLGLRGIRCVQLDTLSHNSFIIDLLSRMYANFASRSGDPIHFKPNRDLDSWCPVSFDNHSFFTSDAMGRKIVKDYIDESCDEGEVPSIPVNIESKVRNKLLALPSPLSVMSLAQLQMGLLEKNIIQGPCPRPPRLFSKEIPSLDSDLQKLLICAFLYKMHLKEEDRTILPNKRVAAVLRFFGMQGHLPRKLGNYTLNKKYRGYYNSLRVYEDESVDDPRLSEHSLRRLEWVDDGWRTKRYKRVEDVGEIV